MKKFRLVAIIFTLVAVLGCKTSVNLEPADVKWDRDVCERCVMQVNDRLHSAQIVDPKSGEHYFFDDLGCASLWLEEQNQPWKTDAIVYITDGLDGKWINKNQAVFAQGFKTPMSFGIAAFKTGTEVPAGKTVLTYSEAENIFLNIKNERMTRRAAEKEKVNSAGNGSMEKSSGMEKTK